MLNTYLMLSLNSKIYSSFLLGIVIGVASLIAVQNWRQHSQSDAARRRYFAAIATGLNTYTTLTKELPTDYRLWKEDIEARPNSWRMAVLSQIAGEYGGVMHSPWFSSNLQQLRYHVTPPFCQPDNTGPVANAVISGGPGAIVPVERGDPKLRQILVVEAYPDSGCWMEGHDLDLLQLLNSQSPYEALQLAKAGRRSFLAIFSDFSYYEINASIPAELLRKWLQGYAISSKEKDELDSYVIWRGDDNGKNRGH